MAGRDAGGDIDIPHRERFKDKQARLNAEAEKRGRQRATEQDALDGMPSDDEDRATAAQLRRDAVPPATNDDDEDYYNVVASQLARKRQDKAALAALHAQAEAEGGLVRVVEGGGVGEDGKRAISYAIEKNKGLTPHRRKEIRNPRVKKRKKFEEKKKKLSSVRAVYKGGEGRGGYGGELTGIKTGLVKGVRL